MARPIAAINTPLGQFVFKTIRANNKKCSEATAKNHTQTIVNFIRNNDLPMTKKYVMSDKYLYDVATSTREELQTSHAIFKNYMSLRRCGVAANLMKRFQTVINMKYNNDGYAGLAPCYYNETDVQEWFDVLYDKLTIKGKVRHASDFKDWEMFLQFFMMFLCAPRRIGAFVFDGQCSKKTSVYDDKDSLCRLGPEDPEDSRFNYIDLDKMVFVLNHYKTKGKHGGFNSKGYGKYYLRLDQFDMYNIFKLDMSKVKFLLEAFKTQYYPKSGNSNIFDFSKSAWNDKLKALTIFSHGNVTVLKKQMAAANAVYKDQRRALREKYMDKAYDTIDKTFNKKETIEHLICGRLDAELHYDEIPERQVMAAISNGSIRKHMATAYISESRILKHLAKDMGHSIDTHVGYYLLSKGYDAATAKRKAGDITKSMSYEDIDDYTESELSDIE
jgi:hypothetical protein